ncbi:CBS domain-containing protein [Pseudomonas sp. MAP12]|uniref:CBS domain-containing protein n=1 Tax=Geopseudomonas aromaticivorans TaxID=2849492 RepID=A0ABS6MUH0_9GAMM|nr:CBS domain-containing protein [Pseudomonas aromaticivorans]MBV2131981.1 CBS domain-containing protein [Pseudomonas aromaticivorans]
MNVCEVMHKPVQCCHTSDSLEVAAQLMAQNDCGAIAVIDQANHPIGIVTDRDIALLAAERHQPLWELQAGELTGKHNLYTCHDDTDVHEALHMMADRKVRRLPVIGSDGELHGMVAMSDILHGLRMSGASVQAAPEDWREALEAFNHITTPSLPINIPDKGM